MMSNIKNKRSVGNERGRKSTGSQAAVIQRPGAWHQTTRLKAEDGTQTPRHLQRLSLSSTLPPPTHSASNINRESGQSGELPKRQDIPLGPL